MSLYVSRVLIQKTSHILADSHNSALILRILTCRRHGICPIYLRTNLIGDFPSTCRCSLEIIWKSIICIHQLPNIFAFRYYLLHILLLVSTYYWEPHKCIVCPLVHIILSVDLISHYLPRHFPPIYSIIRTVSWPPRRYCTIWLWDYELVIL